MSDSCICLISLIGPRHEANQFSERSPSDELNQGDGNNLGFRVIRA